MSVCGTGVQSLMIESWKVGVQTVEFTPCWIETIHLLTVQKLDGRTRKKGRETGIYAAEMSGKLSNTKRESSH
jgi:hypothetical protein